MGQMIGSDHYNRLARFLASEITYPNAFSSTVGIDLCHQAFGMQKEINRAHLKRKAS